MTPLQVLKQHYVGKTITRGVREGNGKKIVDVGIDSYEPMLDFTVTDGTKTETITVLFDWPIGLTE